MDPSLDDQFERQRFDYCFNNIIAANAIQVPKNLQILSDADFECWWSMCKRTSGNLLLLMKEQATGRDFVGTSASGDNTPFNGIEIDLWAGMTNAGAAFPWSVPYIMPATRVFTIALTDYSGAQNTVQIVFSGHKLWPRPKIGDPAAGSSHPSPGTSGYAYGY